MSQLVSIYIIEAFLGPTLSFKFPVNSTCLSVFLLYHLLARCIQSCHLYSFRSNSFNTLDSSMTSIVQSAQNCSSPTMHIVGSHTTERRPLASITSLPASSYTRWKSPFLSKCSMPTHYYHAYWVGLCFLVQQLNYAKCLRSDLCFFIKRQILMKKSCP